MAKNTAISEDIMQDTFVAVWEKCKTLDPLKAKAYLFTAAKNKFFNQVKKEKTILRFEQSQVEKIEKESPEFLLEQKEFELKLESAIEALSEKQRIVFLMNRIDGMTYKEIASRLELSVKAVEKRMHLALKSLGDLIKKKK